jgi:hypothetical protein
MTTTFDERREPVLGNAYSFIQLFDDHFGRGSQMMITRNAILGFQLFCTPA